MYRILFFALLGYLSGSVLYGPLWARLLHTGSITDESSDHNPGVANAFTYGGFRCGVLTLLCELGKGIVPVWLYVLTSKYDPFGSLISCLVVAAPVVGHVFPLYNGFKGGKGIASTFGCLLGLWTAFIFPPAFIMAVSFIFFSLVIKISPHFYRTAVAYLAALPFICVYAIKTGMPSLGLGFIIISVAVGYRLFRSPEEKEKVSVGLLWMH